MRMTLDFLGAAGTVTGSAFLFTVGQARYLIDCGLYQERWVRNRNFEPFPVNPKRIDAVLLTHAHLDHCGLLPKLVKEGFRGPIICTAPTADITRIVLLDSAHIQEEDARFKRLRHQREGRRGSHPELPLYTQEDAGRALDLFQPTPYEEPVSLTPSCTVRFHDAGHILGSAMIEIEVQQASEHRRLVFSGDIGRWNAPILRDPTLFGQADYVVMESTYGGRRHRDTMAVKQQLTEVINATRARRGNVIVPSFAVERTQELLYYLSELLSEDAIPHLMTFVDSPMAIRVTEVFPQYRRYFDSDAWDRIQSDGSLFYFATLKLTRRTDESKAINHIQGSCIIIAGSGMCTGGRVKHHLVNNISRPESTVLFVGYQAQGTLGREIVSGTNPVRIHGQKRAVRAEIASIDGPSAHADHEELLRWFAGLQEPPRRVFVVHGEKQATEALSDALTDQFHCSVVQPDYQDHFELD